jgi:ABC-type transporter Mla subunit MlaD
VAEKDTHATGTPRWVKVFGIIALVLVVLVVVMLVTGRGGHGPGRHMSANSASPDTGGHGLPTPAATRP